MDTIEIKDNKSKVKYIDNDKLNYIDFLIDNDINIKFSKDDDYEYFYYFPYYSLFGNMSENILINLISQNNKDYGLLKFICKIINSSSMRIKLNEALINSLKIKNHIYEMIKDDIILSEKNFEFVCEIGCYELIEKFIVNKMTIDQKIFRVICSSHVYKYELFTNHMFNRSYMNINELMNRIKYFYLPTVDDLIFSSKYGYIFDHVRFFEINYDNFLDILINGIKTCHNYYKITDIINYDVMIKYDFINKPCIKYLLNNTTIKENNMMIANADLSDKEIKLLVYHIIYKYPRFTEICDFLEETKIVLSNDILYKIQYVIGVYHGQRINRYVNMLKCHGLYEPDLLDDDKFYEELNKTINDEINKEIIKIKFGSYCIENDFIIRHKNIIKKCLRNCENIDVEKIDLEYFDFKTQFYTSCYFFNKMRNDKYQYKKTLNSSGRNKEVLLMKMHYKNLDDKYK